MLIGVNFFGLRRLRALSGRGFLLSVPLFAAVCALWVRSYWVTDELLVVGHFLDHPFMPRHGIHCVSSQYLRSSRGSIAWGACNNGLVDDGVAGLGFSSTPTTCCRDPDATSPAVEIAWGAASYSDGRRATGTPLEWRERKATIALWLLAAFAACPVVVRLGGAREKRRGFVLDERSLRLPAAK
jgi:hypothetical protein